MTEIVELDFTLEGITNLLQKLGEREVNLDFIGKILTRIFGINYIYSYRKEKIIRIIITKNEYFEQMLKRLKALGVEMRMKDTNAKFINISRERGKKWLKGK